MIQSYCSLCIVIDILKTYIKGCRNSPSLCSCCIATRNHIAYFICNISTWLTDDFSCMNILSERNRYICFV